MKIGTVGIVGSGLMGSGIGQVVATAGMRATVVDVNAEALTRAKQAIDRSLDRLVKKEVLTESDRQAALTRLTFSTALEDLAGSDLVIEAVTENLKTKHAIFTTLDTLLPRHVLLASNTSSFSVTELAAATGRPTQVLGLHFFNPVPVMALVEVVRTLLVNQEVLEAGVDFVHQLGKVPVQVRDGGGFVVNRLLIPFMMDAVRALEAGVASVGDLDRAMRLGAGHPMGPLTLLDLVGLDTAALAGEQLYTEFRDPRFAPPPLLNRLIAAGRLGRKTGQGFYRYGDGDPTPMEMGQ